MFHFEKKNAGAILLPLLLIGCGETSVHIEEVGPRLQEGFYASENSKTKAVPLVAILKADNQTEAYAFLAHECKGTVRSSFSQTSVAFSDSTPSLGGPHVIRLLEDCDIETEIAAESKDSVRIDIKINGAPQPSYTLHRVPQETFTQAMKDLITSTTNFTSDEKDCVKVFGESCESLKIEGKNP